MNARTANKVRVLPPFQTMWDAYPTEDIHEVGALIGGHVRANIELADTTKRWENSCTVRASLALNQAGDPIPGPGRGKLRNGQTLSVVSGADQRWYAYRVDEFELYLEQTYGAPSHVLMPGPTGVDLTPLHGHKGILVYKVGWANATGHIDLWDGAQVRYRDYSQESKLIKVLFWEASS